LIEIAEQHMIYQTLHETINGPQSEYKQLHQSASAILEGFHITRCRQRLEATTVPNNSLPRRAGGRV